MKSFFLFLIRWYQKNISPLRPPSCRFIPSCSAYAYEAIQVHGAGYGTFLAVKRFLRCHPFHRDKSFVYDPVPKKNG